MAQFPWTFQCGFETGAVDSGGVLTDTQSKSLGYLHYSESQRKYNVLPWRGAYCWGIDQSVHTTTDVLQTVAAFNVADDVYWCIRGAFLIKDGVFANNARVSIVKNISAGPADQGVLQLYYTTAGGLKVLASKANDTAVGTNPAVSCTQNEWHTFEFYGQCDDAGAGTFYFVFDGRPVGNVGSLTNVAFTDFAFGSMDAGAGEFTSGYLFFDDIYAHLDTASIRLGTKNRYPTHPHVSCISTTAYGEHLFVGPGTVSKIQLLTATAGDYIRLYDTDRAYTTDTYGFVAEASIPVATAADNTEVSGPFIFERGCYALIGGTSARAVVHIDLDPPAGYPKAIYYGHPANLKRYVQMREELPGNR